MPEKCPGSDSEAMRKPFGSVVIWSSSVGSIAGGFDDAVAYWRWNLFDLLSEDCAERERCREAEEMGFDIASGRHIYD